MRKNENTAHVPSSVRAVRQKARVLHLSKETGFHALVILFGLFMMYPLLWMLVSSFKEPTQIFRSGFWPTKWIWDSYVTGWAGISGYPFSLFLRNSFILVGAVIAGNLISCSLTAYAFAKLQFPLRGFWFALMLGTLMLPMHVKIIPQYILFKQLSWTNTYLPLIVPSFFATQGFFVFMMTQYMRGLPREMDEAATVDGCGFFRHYATIILPLSIPVLITTSIFTFIWTWNDFFSQMLYLSQLNTFTVALALRMFVDGMGQSFWGALFAMSVVSLIPLFVMFIGFQNYLVEGITAGSIKG